MRLILILVALATLAFGGWWVWGSRAVETVLAEGTGELRAAGWQVDYETDGTGGFPHRFDTDLRDIAVTSPDRQVGWSTPRLRVVLQSYQPNRLIAFAAPRHEVSLPEQKLEITATDPRASGGVSLSSDLPLTDLTVEMDATKIVSSLGYELSFDRAIAALRETEDGAPRSYDVYTKLTGIALPATLRDAYDPSDRLPATIEAVTLEAGTVFDAPVSLSGEPPRLEELALRDLSLDWGDITVSGQGTLNVAPDGAPEGEIVLRVAGWELLLDLAADAGLPVAQSPILRSALQAMADGDVIEAPITFRDGSMALAGLVPLGPAPLLR